MKARLRGRSEDEGGRKGRAGKIEVGRRWDVRKGLMCRSRSRLLSSELFPDWPAAAN